MSVETITHGVCASKAITALSFDDLAAVQPVRPFLEARLSGGRSW